MLGISNAFDEINEVILSEQKSFQHVTKPGRSILERIGTPAGKVESAAKTSLANDIRSKIKGATIHGHICTTKRIQADEQESAT